MEDLARGAAIWRKPFANLESPSILGYTYQTDGKWRVWPRTWSLQSFFDRHAERTVDVIATNYFEVKVTCRYLDELKSTDACAIVILCTCFPA